MADSFDFIIVGSGTAGSTIAYRLSEIADATVLILEAGGTKIIEAVDIPYRWNELLLTEIDWAYMSVPQPGLNNRQVYCASGKLIGGSSNIYHMIHTRGRPQDYDNWAYNGCAGWSFKDVLPYLQKLENQQDNTNPTAGKQGPINVINAQVEGNPVSQTFIDACVEMGYPLVEDFNVQEFGAGWHHIDIKDGKRCGARNAYLEPALIRSNVTLSANSQTTRLLIENNRCVGVEYWQDGILKTARANQEVIVCAGAIQSPKLLMLSGIGQPEHLAQFNIPVVVDLPGVGENFHDHPLMIGPMGMMAEPGSDPQENMTEAALFWGSQPDLIVPDLEICIVHRAPFGEGFFQNVIERVQTNQPVPSVAQLVDPRIILALPGLVSPLSRGWIRLASSDPLVNPLVNPNYGAERADIDRIVTMVKIARDIYQTQAFAKLGLTEINPGRDVRTDEELRTWIINNLGSYYHFVGSCKMGIDNMSVVDPCLKVYGVEGLRVADGSIIPTVPSANPHTSIIMIGEKAADLIKQQIH
ncbi:oxygen-dependent choline dehydrogenase [Microcystis aeruginosa NIES-1211]|jgi:choline dehydrogenase|uniref:Oxygen-dependent choline dehydrogenase n=1 Tax=Microcystis aeruginosa NIES-2519 TaxID=2303981 RepID=A0A5A5R414_MICAE|nr:MULTISPECIES: GMC family oxidoreductase N-terminal domain-containing protein [Microcystis]AVQ71172.1 glucose-methanol-choline oxidoreductase [Microcystis sp. MC19]CCI30822.1 putative choline dehydrogenase betA-like [Microcystis sp. T1-4]GBL13349.1 oxygen-dependent choline dehydrogenase [Microcystis aeruginosa NIES-1211]GCA71024.1 oxygen-dependent choline dehydrogenase [Microcystis aeruginosa NIES-2519]GCA84814.1 oxygen-dependent choline dehydrogenase [Microcystis aeruginosa NIES-2522]